VEQNDITSIPNFVQTHPEFRVESFRQTDGPTETVSSFLFMLRILCKKHITNNGFSNILKNKLKEESTL
jgi:hypothetical protein